MKTKWVSWLVWVLVAGSLLASCRPAAAGREAPAEGAYRLYIAGAFLARSFTPLDPATLDDLPGGPPLAAPLVAGATGVTTEHLAGRANPDPLTVWIVVRDLPGGAERGRFHPPVAGLATGLSAGGDRLLWQPLPAPAAYPPPVDWYVLDTATGAVIARVFDDGNACYRQSAILDAAGTRLYCMVDPALDGVMGLRPLRVAAYDATTGRFAGEVAVPEALAGDTAAGDDPPARRLLEPALALSPDGRTLAVAHAESDRITLIDAVGLAVERSFVPGDGPSLLDLLGVGARRAAAKGTITGTIRQAVFSGDGDRLYVFSQTLLPLDGGAEPGERGLVAIDLARRRVLARGLADYQIQWVLPAPDGPVYAFGTAEARLYANEIRDNAPSMLWRLDGRTLDVLAGRPFEGYRAGRVAGGG